MIDRSSGPVACLTRDVEGRGGGKRLLTAASKEEKLTVTLRLLPRAEILVIRHESDALLFDEGVGSISACHASR